MGCAQLPSIPRFHQALMAEFLGTFFFVFIIGCATSMSATAAVPGATVLVPLAVGLGLTSLVYTFGYISKAQLNPSISLALFVSRIQDFTVTIIFIVVQLIAGILGALTARGVILESDSFSAPAPYDTTPAAQARVFFAEMLFTFLLAWTMINVGVSRQSENSHYGLAIGLVVFVGAMAVGRVSGAAFNPAVTCGLQITQLIDESPAPRRPITWIWLYLLAQITGGSLAGLAYHAVEEKDVTPEHIHGFGRIINAVPNQPTPTLDPASQPNAADDGVAIPISTTTSATCVPPATSFVAPANLSGSPRTRTSHRYRLNDPTVYSTGEPLPPPAPHIQQLAPRRPVVFLRSDSSRSTEWTSPR